MDILSKSLFFILRKPFIFFSAMIFMLAYCIIEYNILYPLFLGLAKIGIGNIFETVVYFFRLILKGLSLIEKNVTLISLFIGVILAGTAILAFLSSGFFNVIKTMIDEKDEKFINGVKKYFVRTYRIFLNIFVVILISFVFLTIVTIPAIVVNRMVPSRPDLTVVSGLLDFITVLVLFFFILVFRLYSFFWVAASFHFEKSFFRIGKIISDRYFWEIFLRIFIMDFIFIVLQAMFINLNNVYLAEGNFTIAGSMLLFVLNWIFKSVFFAVLITYIFVIFKLYKEKVV